jgi:hypothetical protein
MLCLHHVTKSWPLKVAVRRENEWRTMALAQQDGVRMVCGLPDSTCAMHASVRAMWGHALALPTVNFFRFLYAMTPQNQALLPL